MSDTENTTTGKAPAFIAYQVSQKGHFTRIGCAWPNKDSKGFNIQLDAVPLDGRVTLRVASDKKE